MDKLRLKRFVRFLQQSFYNIPFYIVCYPSCKIVRFEVQTLITYILVACDDTIARDTHLGNLDVDCKTAALALINAIICAGPGRTNSSFRMHMRYEFLMLGLDAVIDTLRKYESEALEKHMRIFDDVYLDDMDSVTTRFGVEQIDSNNAIEMATLLADSLKKTPAYEYFTSLLHHIVILPGDRRERESRLKLLAEVAQQICVQEDGTVDEECKG